MARKNLNRGLRPTGRVMLLVMSAVFFGLFVATGVSFARIAHTGMVDEHNLLTMVSNRQLATGVIQSRRGTIMDRNGVVLANQHPSHTLFANHHPDWGSVIEDVAYTAERLAEIIDMSAEEIADILSCREVRFYDENDEIVVMPRWEATFGTAGQRLSFSQRNAIEALNLPGLRFRDDLTRFYPHGSFASHTIGYTFFTEEGGIVGGMGIESYFDNILTATDGEFQFQQDRFAILQPGQQRHYIIPPADGYHITLTLDATIQGFAEEAMNEVVKELDPENIVVVVMRARTGEILAAGSRPTFDPNDRDPGDYFNRIIYQFEPGSTFKIFTYAAAINEGSYRGDQTFVSGDRFVDGARLGDHNAIPSQTRTFDEGFFVSTNSSIIDILNNKITLDRFMEYLNDFGFGQITGLPLSFEHPGLLPNPNSRVNIFTAGFGQGIAVTPIQMLQAASVIVNGGEMIRPQLIYNIHDPNTGEDVHQFEPEVVGNPITAETATQMFELMRGVVHSDVGTGRILYRLDVESAGKTGTAQIFNRGRLLEGVHIYNYIGFAPADDPEIMMFVAVRHEREASTRGGHHYAGQIYRSVMNNTLNYLGLAGNVVTSENMLSSEIERIKTPRVFNLQVEEASTLAKEMGLTPIIIGNGTGVFNQAPAAGVMIPVGDKLFIQTAMEDRLPNFTGWSLAEITQYGRLLELDIKIEGQGVGASQNLRPNALVSQGDSLTITLE